MPYKCSECNKSFRYKVSERTHKCSGNVSLTNDDSNEFLLVSSQKALESRKSVFSSQDNNSTCELAGPAHDRSTLVGNNYVESTDFFSLIMSSTCQYTSDKLQNLRLSPENSMKWEGEKNETMKNDDKLGTNLHSGLIETVSQECLKELLYNVTDYH